MSGRRGRVAEGVVGSSRVRCPSRESFLPEAPRRPSERDNATSSWRQRLGIEVIATSDPLCNLSSTSSSSTEPRRWLHGLSLPVPSLCGARTVHPNTRACFTRRRQKLPPSSEKSPGNLHRSRSVLINPVVPALDPVDTPRPTLRRWLANICQI